jgi:hypothetical protein
VKAYPWIAGMVGLMLTGCANFHHHQAPPPTTIPASTEPVTLPATEPVAAEPASPEILQQKTQSYTESMQQLMASEHDAHPAQPEPATVPAAPAIDSPPPAAPLAAPALQPVAAAPAPAVDVSINPPSHAATTQNSGTVSDGLPSLTQRIDQQAHDQPRDAAAQLDSQLMMFVRNQPVPDENLLSNLPAEDRDVLSAILDGLSNYRDVIRTDPTATTTRKLQPLLDMADRIHASADLSVPALALCSAVRGFGDYDAMNTDNLPSAQSLRTVVYCQVANFASQLNGQEWEIRLNMRLTLYSEATGKSVWKMAEKPIVDRCHQRRHDCYCFEFIELPPDLPAGKYVLTATLEDQISNKLTQATVAMTFK